MLDGWGNIVDVYLIEYIWLPLELWYAICVWLF